MDGCFILTNYKHPGSRKFLIDSYYLHGRSNSKSERDEKIKLIKEASETHEIKKSYLVMVEAKHSLWKNELVSKIDQWVFFRTFYIPQAKLYMNAKKNKMSTSKWDAAFKQQVKTGNLHELENEVFLYIGARYLPEESRLFFVKEMSKYSGTFDMSKVGLVRLSGRAYEVLNKEKDFGNKSKHEVLSRIPAFESA
jgi:hypothetical protein